MVSPKIISFIYNQGIKSVACNKSCSKGICGLVLIDALNGRLNWPWYQVNTRLTLNWHLDRHSINTQLGVDGWQSVDRLMYLLTLTGQFNSRLALNQVLTKYKWRCWVSVDRDVNQVSIEGINRHSSIDATITCEYLTQSDHKVSVRCKCQSNQT